MRPGIDFVAVVDHYKRKYRRRARRELDAYRAESSLEAAVTRAALAEHSDGTRHGHHRRRSEAELRAGLENLVRDMAKLESAVNFAKLLGTVHDSVDPVKGLGETYIYDTALHIGAFKGTLPTRVYLHAGTRDGALALGLDAKKREALDMFELPDALRELEPYEVEDVLCIYKPYFTGEILDLDELPGCPVDDDDDGDDGDGR